MVELKSDVATLETNVSNLIYDIPNVKLDAPLSSIYISGRNGVLMPEAAFDNNFSDLYYCTLVVDGIASTKNTVYRLRMSPEGIQTSTNAGSTWTTLSGGGNAGYLVSKNDSHSAIVALTKNGATAHMTWGIADPSNNNSFIVSGIRLLTTNAIGTYSDVGPQTNAASLNGSIVPKYANGQLSWCYSNNGGSSWTTLSGDETGGGSNSDSDSTAVFVTTSHYGGGIPLGLNMMRMSCDPYNDMVRLTDSSADTGLGYHLQTALGAIGVSEIPTLNADLAIRTRLALVEANDHTAQPKLKYTYNGGATWNDFNTGSSGSANSSITYDSNIDKVVFSKDSNIISIAVSTPSSSALGYYGLQAPFIYNEGSYLRSYLVDNKPVAQVSSNGSTWTTITSGGESSTPTSIPSSIATYVNSNDGASGPISNYYTAGELKVLRSSGNYDVGDAVSGVVTLYLETDKEYVSGVNVLLNAALTAGRKVNNDRYLYGGIRPVISEDEQSLSWEYRRLDGSSWTAIGGEVESTGGSLPDGVSMELLPFTSLNEEWKGRLAQFTGERGTLLATAPGIGLYTGSQSIVACLSAKSVDTSINKTAWQSSYAIYPDAWDRDEQYMDITELIKRRQQLCDIAGHLSQIKWLCENTANIEALLNK